MISFELFLVEKVSFMILLFKANEEFCNALAAVRLISYVCDVGLVWSHLIKGIWGKGYAFLMKIALNMRQKVK